MKPQFFRQIFEKFSDVKFNENPSSGELNCSMQTGGRMDGRTDGRDKSNCRLSEYYEYA